jgi:ABC-type phosphate/phosphonate transport system substrate-binding protein
MAMTRNVVGRLGYAGLSVLIGTAVLGCAGQDIGVFKPLKEVLLMKEPIRIGINRVQLNPVDAPWGRFARALQKKLGTPVQVIYEEPFQIRSQLSRGYLDFAILSATDYAEVGGENCVLLAKPVNTFGQTSRHALIIVKKESRIQNVADLKGQRFAFGPRGDATCDLAAKYCLMQAGLGPGDLQKELLPPPLAGHHLNSFEVAKAVANEPVAAGSVDQLAYASWPEKGVPIIKATPVAGFLQMVSKDRFRVIANTITLPEGPIVASSKADAAMVTAVKEYLLSGEIPETALRPMDWRGFVAVEAGEYDHVAAMLRQLREAGWLKEQTPLPPEPAPAEELAPPTQAAETQPM